MPSQVKEEETRGLKDKAMRDTQKLQESLKWVRKQRQLMEEELADLKKSHKKTKEEETARDELKLLRDKLKNAKKTVVSRKIKLDVVAVDALIKNNRNSRKWGFHELHSECSGNVVEVDVEGSEEEVQGMIRLLKRLTSSYEVLPVKESSQSVLTVGFLEKIRRMTKAAIGLKAGAFFIFGSESERLEAKFVIRQELKLCSSSSWRRWSFLRKNPGMRIGKSTTVSVHTSLDTCSSFKVNAAPSPAVDNFPIPSAPEEEIASVEQDKCPPSVLVGQDCLAKWREDQVWYRGRVADVRDGQALVVFTDYGRFGLVYEKDIVASIDDVPVEDEKNIYVVEASAENNLSTRPNAGADTSYIGATTDNSGEDNCLASEADNVTKAADEETATQTDNKPVVDVAGEKFLGLQIGNYCVACFSEDNVWYNAKVVEVVDNETYRVQFTDYGNEEVVNIERIVTSLEPLVGQMVDVGVNLQLQSCF